MNCGWSTLVYLRLRSSCDCFGRCDGRPRSHLPLAKNIQDFEFSIRSWHTLSTFSYCQEAGPVLWWLNVKLKVFLRFARRKARWLAWATAENAVHELFLFLRRWLYSYNFYTTVHHLCVVQIRFTSQISGWRCKNPALCIPQYSIVCSGDILEPLMHESNISDVMWLQLCDERTGWYWTGLREGFGTNHRWICCLYAWERDAWRYERARQTNFRKYAPDLRLSSRVSRHSSQGIG